ncbi:MAG: TonB-dependent receptor [Bacteroidaceae bacterium]|nr:TonB-dependent receptor [Bacteroidaceae bacterium]
MMLSFLMALLTVPADSLAPAPRSERNEVLREVEVAAIRRMKDVGLEKTELDTTVLHQNIALSMADILTRHSSLFIKQYGRATESTAEFRGTSPSHTQVLWNGMKINSPMLGTVDFSTIPAYFIDQASLFHGASSLAVTGGGLGGAVDLRTLPLYDSGWGLQYVQGVGSYDTYDQFLRLTYGNERWSTSTRVVYSTSDNDFRYTNYDKMVDERDADGTIVRSYHPTERNRSGYFDDIHVLQDVYYRDGRNNRFGAQVWYAHSLRGLPFLSVDYKDDLTFTNEQNQHTVRGVLSWDHTGNDWNTGVRMGVVSQRMAYDYFTRRQEVKSIVTQSRSRSHTAYVQGTSDWMPADNWLFTASASVYYNHVRSRDLSPFHMGDNYCRGRLEEALSLSAKWRPVDRLSLSALLRQECYANDLVPPIPALYIDYQIHRPWGLVLKASVARNYRYPTMDDLYFLPGGNPDLRPERGVTYDGGLEMLRQGRCYTLKGNITAFDSYITDWILWTPNAKGFWQPSNVKKVHNYGLEAHFEGEMRVGSDWTLAASGNFSYTPSLNRGEELSGADASYGKQLCYVPRTSANVAARVQWRSWLLAYQWTHYGERFTTTSNEVNYITGRLLPYYMSDVTLEKRFQWRWMHASVKAAVYNILGTEYVTVLARPMAGRHFEIFLELKPQWKRRK